MRKIIICALLGIVLPFSASAQNNKAKMDDFGRVILSSYLDASKSKIPATAFNQLKNKLSQIAANNGLGGSVMQRFIITANVDVVSQDITPTAPPMHAYNLNITFYIGDGIDGTLFSSTSVSAKGVGETPDKAYISALKAVRPNDPAFTSFIEKGKNKIIEYYNANGDMFISKALTLASQEKYDEAILMLMNIPEVCKEVYQKAMNEVSGIYQSKIDKESMILLNKAQTAWNQSRDAAAAKEASKFLEKIHPYSSCADQANSLIREINTRMTELDERAWKMEVLEKEQAHAANIAAINAAKEVAVAEAQNQPEVIYKYYWW